MSTEYSLVVYRKEDNKKIGSMICNFLRTLRDNGYIDLYDIEGRELTYDDFLNISHKAKEKIISLYAKIHEKKMMIPMCKSVEIKRDIEDEIRCLEEDIQEEFYVIECDNLILGQLYFLIENNIIDESEDNYRCAYQENGKDLPPDKNGYKRYLWISDVYFKVEAN